jgi:hypothetical protein
MRPKRDSLDPWKQMTWTQYIEGNRVTPIWQGKASKSSSKGRYFGYGKNISQKSKKKHTWN